MAKKWVFGIMSDGQRRVSVQSFDGIVQLGKSKRLSAMRSDLPAKVSKPITVKAEKKLTELEHARLLIEQKIQAIKASYPKGKCHKLFVLRYTSEEKLQQMNIGEVLGLLHLERDKFKRVLDFAYCEL